MRTEPSKIITATSFSYLPALHEASYHFSTKDSFKLRIDSIDEAQVKQVLRTFVDFLKAETESRQLKDVECGMIYEPLLSHLILNKQRYLM